MLSELILAGRRDDVVLCPIVPEASRTLALAIREDKVLTMPLKRLIAITKEFVRDNSDKFLVNLNKTEA